MGIKYLYHAITESVNLKGGHLDLPQLHRSVPRGAILLAKVATGSADHSLGTLFSQLRFAVESLWNELAWLIVPFFVVLLIKRYLLNQSFAEIFACIFDVTAFLLKHVTEITRYVAIHLKQLAKQLREKPKSR